MELTARSTLQIIIAMLGGFLGYFIGPLDSMLGVLIVFVICDYITGVLCGIADKKLSSAVGFKGIAKKVTIFMMVGIANMLDMYILHTNPVLRTATIFFYISNEGISLLENSGHLGVEYPQKLKDILEQLKKEDKDE